MIKLVKILIEALGWLFIAGGTTLGAGLISFFIYYKLENETASIAVLVIGFLIGALWATRISIKYGTMEWLSRIRHIS